MSLSRNPRCTKGQAVVEMALVLPLLLLLIMGVMTFGMMIYAKMLVVLSSSQGANEGSYVYSDPTLSLEQKEEKILTAAYFYLNKGLGGTDRKVVINVINGDRISVKVTYNYNLIFPLLGEIFKDKTKIPLEYESVYMIQ